MNYPPDDMETAELNAIRLKLLALANRGIPRTKMVVLLPNDDPIAEYDTIFQVRVANTFDVSEPTIGIPVGDIQ